MNFSAIAADTANKIKNLGMPAVLNQRSLTSYDPATGVHTHTTLSYPGYYLETGYSSKDKDGQRAEEVTIKAIAAGFSVRVMPGDTITVDNKTLLVLIAESVSPNGVIIYQDLEVRA